MLSKFRCQGLAFWDNKLGLCLHLCLSLHIKRNRIQLGHQQFSIYENSNFVQFHLIRLWSILMTPYPHSLHQNQRFYLKLQLSVFRVNYGISTHVQLISRCVSHPRPSLRTFYTINIKPFLSSVRGIISPIVKASLDSSFEPLVSSP